MISIICVYDDENVLRANLLNSLKNQSAEYELILVDNTGGLFKSLPKALNYGGSKAKGEYLMFVHQDIELIGNNWLKKAEKILTSINDLGIAGVAGMDFNGNPVGFIIDRGKFWGSPIKEPKKVMTLDEQLTILPRKVFNVMKFYEGFKWHSWAADMCLCIQLLGLKAYVLPLPVSHNSSTLPILKAGKIEEDDLKLWMRHHKKHPTIYKTTGIVTFNTLLSHKKPQKTSSFIRPLTSLLKSMRYRYRIIYGDYKTMLDIVVPCEQPSIKGIKLSTSYSVGISNKIQYLLASKRIGVHADYIHASMENPPFRRRAFDIIIVKGCLEYLYKHEGERLLNILEKIGRRIVVWVPNNGLPMSPAYRCYRSIWHVNELKNKGYKVYGSRLIIGTKIKNTFRKYFDYVGTLISWHLPRFSRILIAIKKLDRV